MLTKNYVLKERVIMGWILGSCLGWILDSI